MMGGDKRILMLNYEFPPLGGGGGIAAFKLAKGFIDNGYEVDYLTTWFRGLKKFEVVDGINVYRVKVIGRKKLPTATMISMISFPFFAYKKAKVLCKKNKYDFINTHFAVPTGPLGVKISKEFDIPNILSLHGGDIYDPSKTRSPHRKWYFRKVVNWVLNNSDFIIAQSSNTKENTIKYYSPKKDISIIPLAYDEFKFDKVSRKDLSLNENKKYVIGIGRLIKRKDFESAIKAINEIQNKDIELLIIGDGPDKESLIKLSKDLNISKRVHFLGFVSEEKKYQYLSLSDVYLLSSLHEGFGIVLQEAMQVALPIVATNNGGQVDIIKEGENGYLVKVGDYKAMADKIMECLSHKDKFSKNNIEKSKSFSPKNIAKDYLVGCDIEK